MAKTDIGRWTLDSGHRMVDIVRWTSYVGHCTGCSQDQHAQAQHWLRHAQAQLMHAQAGAQARAQAQHWIMRAQAWAQAQAQAQLQRKRLATCQNRMGRNAGWTGWAGMRDGPDRQDSLSIRMGSRWTGMPDGPDGVYRMEPGWVPTALTRAFPPTFRWFVETRRNPRRVDRRRRRSLPSLGGLQLPLQVGPGPRRDDASDHA